MPTLKRIWNFVVYSSENSNKISLTLKGLLPFLVMLNIGDPIIYSGIIDNLVNVFVTTVTWVTGLVALYGAIRKVKNNVEL